MAHGRFITVEGGEGAGKSTQAPLLVAALEQAGIAALATREPGGSPGAEAIRRLLLEGARERWDAASEALLLVAARRDHVARPIRPALGAAASGSCATASPIRPSPIRATAAACRQRDICGAAPLLRSAISRPI